MEKIVREIIKTGSKLPPGLKGGFVERVFSHILLSYRKNYKPDHHANSNLGISKRLNISLPIQEAPSMFFFGTPESYLGEYHTVRLAAFLSKHASTFIDIGANWGFFCYYVSFSNPSIPIYWFEPNPALYKSIVANAGKNGLQNMTGSQQAISDSNGSLTFYVENGSGFNSSLVKPPEFVEVSETTVEVIRFDDWIKRNNIGSDLLVKVDVENAEWNFVKGATGQFNKIEYLIIEVLGPARQSGFVNYMIDEMKMEAYYINEARIEHVPREDMRYTKGEYNWLFCRHRLDVLEQKLQGSIFTVVV